MHSATVGDETHLYFESVGELADAHYSTVKKAHKVFVNNVLVDLDTILNGTEWDPNIAKSSIEKLREWSKLHSDVTPLDGTDRNSPTFGDLRELFRVFENMREPFEAFRQSVGQENSSD